MGRFSKEKVTSISLSIYSMDELEDLIIKMAKLIEEGYSINTISDLRYECSTSFVWNDPIFTIELTKYAIR